MESFFNDPTWEAQIKIVGYTLLAAVLGGVLGLEREYVRKPAGLRTHILVAAAAALLVGISRLMLATEMFPQDTLNYDPNRLLEAVITGISFLGAGTILRREKRVEGLTTAATLLFTAVIGIGVGLGFILVGVLSTLLALFVLYVLGRIDPGSEE